MQSKEGSARLLASPWPCHLSEASVSPRNRVALVCLLHSINGWEQSAGSVASTNTAMDFRAALGRLWPVTLWCWKSKLNEAILDRAGWAPIEHDWCCYKKGGLNPDTCTGEQGNAMWRCRWRWVILVQAKECQRSLTNYQKQVERHKQSYQKEPNPADTHLVLQAFRTVRQWISVI